MTGMVYHSEVSVLQQVWALMVLLQRLETFQKCIGQQVEVFRMLFTALQRWHRLHSLSALHKSWNIHVNPQKAQLEVFLWVQYT